MAILKHNNNSISNVTSFAQVPAGQPVLLSTATASSSASISFNSTYINSDYKIYKFEFINIHGSNDGAVFTFNLSTDNGSNYNVTKTTTFFQAFHAENDTSTSLTYDVNQDLAQSTGFQRLFIGGNDNDQNAGGNLLLFNPSSSIYVKHFISCNSGIQDNDYAINTYIAGYGNTTSAVNAIQFKFDAGNIDAGQIKLYGIGAN